MANKHRGEASIKIGDKTYTMRVSHKGLVALEERLRLSVIVLARKCFEGTLSYTEMVVTTHAAIEAAHKEPPTIEQVAEHVIAVGVSDFSEPMSDFFLQALEGGGQAKNVVAPARK